MQSNHFETPGISVKASVAKIPWQGSSFVGFFAGEWISDRMIQFTTYNVSKLRALQIDEKTVQLTIQNRTHKIELNVQRSIATQLGTPIQGLMDGRIEETMTSIMEVILTDNKTNRMIFERKVRNVGLEVAGRIEEITTPS